MDNSNYNYNEIKSRDRLDEKSPIPLYFQLQEIIKRKIESGEYKPGDLIPTERELQEKYGVSRITVRNAIEGLVFEDLLVKKQGLGTMVARPRMVEDFSNLRSFTEKMEAQGAKIDTKVLEVRKIGAPERIATHLKVDPGSEIIYVKRLRFVDGEPIALFSSYIRGDIGIGEWDDFTGSVYRLMEKEKGIKISGAEKIIEATSSTGEEAELLGINPEDPILIIRNTTFDHVGTPIEHAEGVYRSDRYKYIVKLKR
ncbi:MAG: GntR family transcriptional regulator [Spirochaetes bacterium]|nr:MAG: GntR family transcriptional regulator [Spirochaetota bacterium]